MNCQHCQRRLMSIEKPAYAEPLVAAHLTECASCREFQRLLLRVEANVRRVPVPPSRKKARFLERIPDGKYAGFTIERGSFTKVFAIAETCTNPS